MGLFDRIRGDDKEVEIKPPERRERYDYGENRERERGSEDSGDEFVLPGMKAAQDSSSSSREGSRGSSSSSRRRSRRDDGVDRIIEQNERIIELLEEIADTGSGTDSVL